MTKHGGIGKRDRRVLKSLILLALAALLTIGASPRAEDSDLVRQTVYGAIQGAAVNNGTSLAWLGVPYAKPPLGELRWRPPQSPDSWSGVRKTAAYPNRAPQPSGGNAVGDEDCLYLNIWRPATMETNLPVMFFIHGGSNQTGTGESLPGDNLSVQANCVVVTINYRLGALGWLHHPLFRTGEPYNDSGNWGLLDAAKALEWVRDNIRNFGGDPGNVAISGSSAGGRDCLALMISPIAKGLFHKALIFCGGLTVADPKMSEKIADSALRKVIVADGKAADEEAAGKWMDDKSRNELLAYFRGVSADKFVMAMKPSELRMGNFPHLFRDGVVIPRDGFDTLAGAAYSPIPVIVGAADREFITFAVGDPYFNEVFFGKTLAENPENLKLFVTVNDYASRFYSGFNLETVMDKLLTNPGQPASFAYRIGWGRDPEAVEPPYNEMLGGSHTSDGDFMTGHWDYFLKVYPQYYTEANLPGRQDLSRRVMAYFRNFLHTGNPNGEGLPAWQAYTAGNEQMIHFSADADKADVKMIRQHITRDKALADMKKLEGLELGVLQYIMAGRFFYDVDY